MRYSKRLLKITTIIIATLTIFTVVLVNTEYVTADTGQTQFSKKILEMRQLFPDGMYWNHIVTSQENTGDNLMSYGNEEFADSTSNCPCYTHNGVCPVGEYDCNYFDGGIQCVGFAHRIYYGVFGERASGGAWVFSRYTTVNGENRGDIRTGDVVRTGTFENGHSAFVLSRVGDELTIVECNNGYHGGNCNIKWDSTMNVNNVTYYCRASNYDEVMRPIDVPISKTSIKVSDVTYSGKAKKPDPVITYEGKTLVNGTDYVCKYKNNIKVGTATVKIIGKGNYKGSFIKYFKIKPKNTYISKCIKGDKCFTVNWKKRSSNCSGYQIRYSTYSKFSSYKIITIKGKNHSCYTVKKLAVYTKYYVEIRVYYIVDGKTYYSNWSTVSVVTTKDAYHTSYGKTYTAIKKGNYVYCPAGGNIYKVNIKTKKKTLFVKSSAWWVDHLSIYGNYLYYIRYTMKEYPISVCRVSLSSGKNYKLLNAVGYYISNRKIYYAPYIESDDEYDDWAYYIQNWCIADLSGNYLSTTSNWGPSYQSRELYCNVSGYKKVYKYYDDDYTETAYLKIPSGKKIKLKNYYTIMGVPYTWYDEQWCS